MLLNSPRDPKGEGYPWGIRITVGGIDCYSVGADEEMETEALKAQLEDQEGVTDAEVVRYG